MLFKDEVLQERYRIVRQLGQGGMGAVYEAIDERFGTPVALKEILIASLGEEQRSIFVSAFEREAKSLATARHEAVPFVRDYFSERDRQFLVMELVEGDDLGEMLQKRKKSFPLDEVVRWADQLLDALDYLHNLTPPIIHRDIKPQNLKLNSRGKLKLLDFGIAKSGGSSSTVTNQTFIGATLNYSPIEQILRVIDPTFREFIILKHEAKANGVLDQNSDARTDIYALGATFYHLLTNRLPIDATKRTLEIWEGKTDPLPNPAELNPAISSPISDWLLRAMEIEAENRFSSAIEMQQELETAIARSKSGNQASEKTFVLPARESLSDSAEQIKMPEQILTAAPTEKLISEREIDFNAKAKDFAATRPAPTQAAATPVSNTSSSDEQTPVTEPFVTQASNTDPAGAVSGAVSGVTQPSDEVRHEQPRIDSLPVVKAASESAQKRGKRFWLLPAAAAGILAVSGIGGVVWMNGSTTVDSTGPATNAANSNWAPVVAPATKPTTAPSTTPEPEKVETKNEKPKVVGAATPHRTPVPKPVITPKPPKPRPTQDPNCVFTNSCR